MAGDDDADRVAPVGQTDRAGRRRDAEPFGELSVRKGLAVRDGAQRRPDAALEGRAVQDERQVEGGQLTAEVGPELGDGQGERRLVGVRRAAEGLLGRAVALVGHV